MNTTLKASLLRFVLWSGIAILTHNNPPGPSLPELVFMLAAGEVIIASCPFLETKGE